MDKIGKQKHEMNWEKTKWQTCKKYEEKKSQIIKALLKVKNNQEEKIKS